MSALRVMLCNGSDKPLTVLSEPWCDEFILPPRAKLSLEAIGEGQAEHGWPEIDDSGDVLTVYGAGGTLLRVEVSGVESLSVSAAIRVPDLGSITTREFVGAAFGK